MLLKNDMQIVQTKTFERSIKKLHSNQKKDLDETIKQVITDPHRGTPKKGDLAGTSVYKFEMVNQLALLAYTFDENSHTLILLALGSHENFYRDLKK